MKKLYKFSQFLNEKNELEGGDKAKKEIERDVKKLASEMFDKTRNLHFDYKDGLPSAVIFEVTEKDYKLDYDEVLAMEYSENVLKKRSYKVELKFKKKNEEKVSDTVSKYIMKFSIKLTKSDNVKFDVKSDFDLVWDFEEKPTEVISFVKKNRETCRWEDPLLKIAKSSWDTMPAVELRRLIKKNGGIKKKSE